MIHLIAQFFFEEDINMNILFSSNQLQTIRLRCDKIKSNIHQNQKKLK